MNTGISKNDTNTANTIEDCTLFSMCFVSFFASAVEISGTIAVASEPIIDDGIYKNGNAIPTATPYISIDWLDVKPDAMSIAGRISAISG